MLLASVIDTGIRKVCKIYRRSNKIELRSPRFPIDETDPTEKTDGGRKEEVRRKKLRHLRH